MKNIYIALLLCFGALLAVRLFARSTLLTQLLIISFVIILMIAIATHLSDKSAKDGGERISKGKASDDFYYGTWFKIKIGIFIICIIGMIIWKIFWG